MTNADDMAVLWIDHLPVVPFRRRELLALLSEFAGADATSALFRMHYTNAHVFNLATDDEEFRSILTQSDALIFEGYGGVLAAQLLGLGKPEQLATMSWIDDFLADVSQLGCSVYLLGDQPSVAARCADVMKRRHPLLAIAGVNHGYFDHWGEEGELIVQEVNASGADVLLIGMGSPLQEKWIESHRGDLNASLALSLGAMFRWYSGAEIRAPAWMQSAHLEWLHRLASHPIRHFRRYVIGNLRFLGRVFRARWRPT